MTLSRRGFLQVAGLTLAATQLDLFTPLAMLATNAPVKGRVLESVSVGGKALWPDSVVTILEADETRYRLADGWLPRSAIQPMYLDALQNEVWPEAVVFAEVHAPIVAVRRAASAAAPLLTRIGHGGVVFISRTLQDAEGRVEWLEIAFEHDVSGWVQAAHVRPLTQGRTETVDRLVVDLARQQLTALSGETFVLSTPISTAPNAPLQRGETHLHGLHAWTSWPLNDSVYYGVPWTLQTARFEQLSAVYWHNRFGTPQPGPNVQLPPYVARWLFANTTFDARLTVI